MDIYLLCVAALALPVFAGGFYVSSMRSKHRRGAGLPEDTDHPLFRAIRAHGNSTEYAAILSVLFIAVSMQDPAPWVGYLVIVMTLARYLVFYALLTAKTLNGINPFRFTGMLTTYIGGLVLIGVLIMEAMK